MSKKIVAISINPEDREDYIELAREIAKGNFRINVVSPPPIPILESSQGARSPRRVIGYRPSPELPKIYIETLDEKEDPLFDTARILLDYYETQGEEEFRRRFFSLDIIPVCKKIVDEGKGNPHPWGEEEE